MNQHPEILRQLKEGSYKAFNSLYEQYFDLLYGFIFGLTRSHEQTRELVQEAFIKVWINRQKIDLNLSFKAWLFKMAQNQLKDQLKKQFNNPIFEDYLIHCSDEQLSLNEQDSFDFEAFNHSLTKAKEKLSPRQVQIFELTKEQGLSATEVADRLQISEQSVYNYLHQALSILRKEMSAFYTLFLMFFLHS
ncbi:RNA polymerase sigma factor [Parabacteroides sp. AF17-28]|uniref:RNA polymerase sigma factor n=1 Tax=Parabacteroides sp. AF17-28 TaxID=2292241 RepID=UPI000EFDBDDA|nr:RNA polymerase sigma factor [Parabacteroides sp. AF17-28]RHR55688.1 RNA polymerase sigma factor [Parabacteroides sp. AF17-28]